MRSPDDQGKGGAISAVFETIVVGAFVAAIVGVIGGVIVGGIIEGGELIGIVVGIGFIAGGATGATYKVFRWISRS